MSIQKRSDGKTVLYTTGEDNAKTDEQKQRGREFSDKHNDPTVLHQSPGASAKMKPHVGASKTQLVSKQGAGHDPAALKQGEHHSPKRKHEELRQQEKISHKPLDEAAFTVAWLVVIDGPGMGHSAPIGYGRNSIGRTNEARITLDFGDKSISRKAHAHVTYDGKHRKYYVQQGDSDNLVYLEGGPVMIPTELKPYAEIVIGNTKLRFVPFCNEEFDWQDR